MEYISPGTPMYNAITKALFENYESIYDIEPDSGRYQCCHESAPYKDLLISKRGDDFFAALGEFVPRVIHPEDQKYVLYMLRRDVLLDRLTKEKYHSFVYRLILEGEPVYHRIRATSEIIEGKMHILLGVRDVHETIMQEKELLDLERELQLARLRNFTSQMHPHFLYNTLGSIQEMIIENPHYAAELLGDFTTYLRGSIRSMTADKPVPFSQELENIRAYVSIEKMRFGDKLKVEYDIQAQDFLILQLSIQPLVENAIRHGIYERGPRGGTVKISSREEDTSWVVIIEDDGVGFDVDRYEAEMSEGATDSTGLHNIRFRLNAILHAGVRIASRPDEGTRVTVSVPKNKGCA